MIGHIRVTSNILGFENFYLVTVVIDLYIFDAWGFIFRCAARVWSKLRSDSDSNAAA
jgi:hypothetical protein